MRDDDVMPVWWFGEGVALFPVASVAVARVVQVMRYLPAGSSQRAVLVLRP